MRFAAIALLTVLSGCFMLTDAATRLAAELGARAEELRASSSDRLEFRHMPDGFPDGAKGSYEITLQQSTRTTPFTRALLVADLGSEGHQKHGYNWSTTSHLHHVGVPATLTIKKPVNEPTIFVLQKSGEAIDVVELR